MELKHLQLLSVKLNLPDFEQRTFTVKSHSSENSHPDWLHYRQDIQLGIVSLESEALRKTDIALISSWISVFLVVVVVVFCVSLNVHGIPVSGNEFSCGICTSQVHTLIRTRKFQISNIFTVKKIFLVYFW